MGYESLVAQVPELERELEKALGEKKALDRRVEALRQTIDGLRALGGATPPEPQHDLTDAREQHGEGLSGAPAIRRVFAEDPTRIWRVIEVFNELKRRGWVSPNVGDPRRGVDAAMSRLVQRDEIERVAPGRYRLARADETSLATGMRAT